MTHLQSAVATHAVVTVTEKQSPPSLFFSLSFFLFVYPFLSTGCQTAARFFHARERAILRVKWHKYHQLLFRVVQHTQIHELVYAAAAATADVFSSQPATLVFLAIFFDQGV